MHELSLCRSIYRIVTRTLETQNTKQPVWQTAAQNARQNPAQHAGKNPEENAGQNPAAKTSVGHGGGAGAGNAREPRQEKTSEGHGDHAGAGSRRGPRQEKTMPGSTCEAESTENDPRVTYIDLDIGVLRQVVPATLEHCWNVTTRRTPLAGSRLRINYLPARITCGRCGAETAIGEDLIFACGACGSVDYQVQSGEEFQLTAIEISDNT